VFSISSSSYEAFAKCRQLLHGEIEDVAQFTKDLALSPYDPETWLNRAHYLRILGFPELGLGDAYKARLLIEAALAPSESQVSLGEDTFRTFSEKVYAMHASNPAWAVHVDTKEKLKERTQGMLKRLEIQCWTESMEGLMAANCSKDYLDMSNEAVKRFPDDEVFPSEGKSVLSTIEMLWFQIYYFLNINNRLL